MSRAQVFSFFYMLGPKLYSLVKCVICIIHSLSQAYFNGRIQFYPNTKSVQIWNSSCYIFGYTTVLIIIWYNFLKFYYVALKASVGFKVAFNHKTWPVFLRPRVIELDFLFEREMFVP